MRGLSKFLVLIFISCGSVKDRTRIEPLIIPYSSVLPFYTIEIEDIPFLADLDNDAENVLCSLPSIYEGGYPGKQSIDSLSLCRAKYTCYPAPAEGYMPAMNKAMWVGSKIVPGFTPTQLKSQLTSAFGGIGNVKQFDSMAKNYTSGASQYVIKVSLTEFHLSTDKSTSGFGGIGVGPLAILSLISVEKKQTTGFIRFDFRIIDSTRGTIKSAFSVAGSSTDAHMSSGMMSGSVSSRYHQISLRMQEASRAALDEGAKRVFAELQRL